jgi:hypothetical protein
LNPTPARRRQPCGNAYFNATSSFSKLATRLVPKDCRIAMIATEMQAADQSIFDRGGARVIIDKVDEEIAHDRASLLGRSV